MYEESPDLILLMDILSDTVSESPSVLAHYLNKAELSILNYCNLSEIPIQYNNVLVDLAIFYYQNRKSQGITQTTQGSRSKTIVDGIPESIKSCLPLPKVKVI